MVPWKPVIAPSEEADDPVPPLLPLLFSLLLLSLTLLLVEPDEDSDVDEDAYADIVTEVSPTEPPVFCVPEDAVGVV